MFLTLAYSSETRESSQGEPDPAKTPITLSALTSHRGGETVFGFERSIFSRRARRLRLGNRAFDPFRVVRTAVPFGGQTSQIISSLSSKRDCSPNRVNPFRTAVPFWGQTSQFSSIFVPRRDCGSKGVKAFSERSSGEST